MWDSKRPNHQHTKHLQSKLKTREELDWGTNTFCFSSSSSTPQTHLRAESCVCVMMSRVWGLVTWRSGQSAQCCLFHNPHYFTVSADHLSSQPLSLSAQNILINTDSGRDLTEKLVLKDLFLCSMWRCVMELFLKYLWDLNPSHQYDFTDAVCTCLDRRSGFSFYKLSGRKKCRWYWSRLNGHVEKDCGLDPVGKEALCFFFRIKTLQETLALLHTEK